MSTLQLQKLWRLHEIDAGIVEIRNRAASLDPGRAIQATIQRAEQEFEEKRSEAKRLSSDQADLELTQEGIDDKLKRIDKELYGGGVVNPREVETMEKEILNLKRQKEANDEKLLVLLEQLPSARAAAEDAERRVAGKKAELAEYQKKVLAVKSQLEQEFKRLSGARPAAASEIDAPLLTRYDAIRNKHGGIGMAKVIVDKKQTRCSTCGMALPEKTVEAAKEGRLVTCESCHRLLYYTEGLV